MRARAPESGSLDSGGLDGSHSGSEKTLRTGKARAGELVRVMNWMKKRQGQGRGREE